jgi:FKBP-type peptidyl-prolyl cis-trans isomerase
MTRNGSSVLTVLVVALALALALAAPSAFAQREKLPPDDYDYVYKKWPNVKETGTGIRYIIEREGTGAPANPGDVVSVLYEGRLLNGTPFDKNLDKDHPFVFRVKRGQVIAAWDQILQLMKVGEKRMVIIPSELAYGSRGRLPDIPRDATLWFEIQLLKIEREE